MPSKLVYILEDDEVFDSIPNTATSNKRKEYETYDDIIVIDSGIKDQSRDSFYNHHEKKLNSTEIHDDAVEQLVGLSGKAWDEVSRLVWEIMLLQEIEDVDSIVEICFDDVFKLPNSSSSSSSSSNASSSTSTSWSSSSSSRKHKDPDIMYVSVPITSLSQVLAIFPNAKRSYVDKLLTELSNDSNVVIQAMAEKGFEKEEVKSNADSKEKEYNFMSLASFEPSPQYNNQAFFILQCCFPYFYVVGLNALYNNEKHKHHLSIAIDTIESSLGIESAFDIREFLYNKRKTSLSSKINIPAVLLQGEKQVIIKSMGLKLKAKATVAAGNQSLADISTGNLDGVLEKELFWLSDKKVKLREQSDHLLAEKMNEQIATEAGALLECGCCFSEYPFEHLVQCSEGDLFCKDCLKSYVETVVFGEGRSTIRCMNTGSACPGQFPESMLKNSLPEKTFAKYQDVLMKDVLKSAQLEGMCTCHHCSYMVEMAEDAGNVMMCPQCHKETCRECGDESHVPLRCNEVEKKGQTEVRLTVEEAMTNARIRQCPKCKTRFYKIEGCNKMSCSCGTIICYICRMDIAKPKYTHFCQAAHCDHSKCNKCRLFTDSAEDDILAMREAGLKALQSGKEAGDATANTGPNVEIDKLLEASTKTKPILAAPRQANLPQPPHVRQPLGHMPQNMQHIQQNFQQAQQLNMNMIDQMQRYVGMAMGGAGIQIPGRPVNQRNMPPAAPIVPAAAFNGMVHPYQHMNAAQYNPLPAQDNPLPAQYNPLPDPRGARPHKRRRR